MAAKNHEYAGAAITVRFDTARCIHAAKCVRGLPAVFNTKERRWVKVENADADEVAATVMTCPSGALHYERHDGGAAEVAPNENVIRTRANGPHYVHGDLRILTANGELRLHETRVALCRCGASQNKPFCDNSHTQIAFADAANWKHEVALQERREKAQGLNFTPTLNGSLKVEGEVALYNASGELAFRGDVAYLCRCGASQNKPFCDGSHARVGFRE